MKGSKIMRKTNKKKSHKEFVNELKEKNPNIRVIGQYQTAKDKIECECLICNTHWLATPNKLLLGRGCPVCGEKKCRISKRIKQEDFINRLKEINPNIEPLEAYTTLKTKMLFRCNICNNEWKTIPDVVLGGHTCPKCSHKQSGDIWRKSKDTFVKEISNINSNIEITGEYINDSTQIECLCKICNTKWRATPNNLLHNSGCPKCKSSKGENKIDKYLSSNNVCFNRQHKFKDCKNIRTLPFDFYLPDYNTCIEYDGELHYKAVDYFGGDDALSNTKCRDEIKTQYCKENNIKLIRIPYWEFDNIESILDRELEVG